MGTVLNCHLDTLTLFVPRRYHRRYGTEARYGATPLGWLVDLLPGTSLGSRQARDARDDRTAQGKGSAVQGDNGDDDEYDDAVLLRGREIESDPHFHVYYELYDVISQMSLQNESLMIQANYTKGGACQWACV